MAFKGTNETETVEEQRGAENVVKRKIKRLLNDHCLSTFNLTESVWRDSSTIDTSIFDMLERLNSAVKTNGVNITLEWTTENDLDIHVKCGCGKWT